jgi:hypothetical protein
VPDLISPDMRRRLRDLILKSKDPRRRLEIFRSRKPAALFEFGKSSPSSISRPPPDFPPPTPWSAMNENPLPTNIIETTDSVILDSLSDGDHIEMSTAEPCDAAPTRSIPTLISSSGFTTSLTFDPLPNPMNTPPPQSTCPRITHFFQGSNHRIKLGNRWAIKWEDSNTDNHHRLITLYHCQYTRKVWYLILMADKSKLETTKASPPPPGYVLAKKSLLIGFSDSSTELDENSGEGSTGAGDGVVASGNRRSGKEIVRELGTEEEKKALVVNLKKSRGNARGRFLAVGVFLSVLLITSKNLMQSMRKIWRIRGHLDINQLADRKFVLEFSEEGDFTHVTKGGPWSYKDDPVLVEELKEGINPETVQFTTIPIWTQFKNIPFYLLSKKLARDLGNKVGELICIDNHSRGDICNKFIRARVHLPINKALQRWVPIVDEITSDEDDEVIVSVFYERLPTFCFFCGLIGHRDVDCRQPGNTKKRSYGAELGVMPIHRDDPRCWFLPEVTGQVRQHHSPDLPWRTTLPTSSKPAPEHHQAIVAHVATEVGKLSVNELPTPDEVPPKIVDNILVNNSPAHTHDLQHDSNQACIATSPAPTETLQLVAGGTRKPLLLNLLHPLK